MSQMSADFFRITGMNFEKLIGREAVFVGVRAEDKRKLLAWVADRAATLTGADGDEILQALRKREELGSTGIGKGTALPHVRLPSVISPVGLFVRLSAPIAFDSIDGEPVDLVCLLLLPEAGGEALNALSAVARAFREPAELSRFRAARDSKALGDILHEQHPDKAQDAEASSTGRVKNTR
jgi:PTS system nitrogen regulatory IIA component